NSSCLARTRRTGTVGSPGQRQALRLRQGQRSRSGRWAGSCGCTFLRGSLDCAVECLFVFSDERIGHLINALLECRAHEWLRACVLGAEFQKSPVTGVAARAARVAALGL